MWLLWPHSHYFRGRVFAYSFSLVLCVCVCLFQTLLFDCPNKTKLLIETHYIWVWSATKKKPEYLPVGALCPFLLLLSSLTIHCFRYGNGSQQDRTASQKMRERRWEKKRIKAKTKPNKTIPTSLHMIRTCTKEFQHSEGRQECHL